jgi:hypothetical protein
MVNLVLTSWNGTSLGTGTTPEGTKMTYGAFTIAGIADASPVSELRHVPAGPIFIRFRSLQSIMVSNSSFVPTFAV